MRSILVFLFLVFISALSAQVKNTGFPHYEDVPSSPPPFLPFSSEVRYDISRQQLYLWNRELLMWVPSVDTTTAVTGLATRGYSDAGDNILAQVIADSSHWQRSGDSLFYTVIDPSPIRSFELIFNDSESAARVNKFFEILPGESKKGEISNYIANNAGSSNTGNRKEFIVEQVNVTGNANDLDFIGTKYDVNLTGIREGLKGITVANLTSGGGNASVFVEDITHNYASWPATNFSYTGRRFTHNFPEFGTNSRNVNFYGERHIINALGETNLLETSNSGFFHGISIEMNVAPVPSSRQRVAALRIRNFNAHPDAYAIYQDAGEVRNYFAGRIGVGNLLPAYTLDIGGTNAVKFPVGTTAQRPTGVRGLLRGNSSHGGFDLHDGTAWRRLAAYTDVTPADGNILVYDAVAGAFVPTEPNIKLFTPTSSADATGNIGDITYNDDYIFVKTSAGWKRSTLASF